MKREIISQALNALDERHISETAGFDPKLMQSSPERSARVKTKRIITLALAAALIIALGAAAYASDIFGIKTMAIDNDEIPADVVPDYTIISVSQPQEVEDTQDAAIKEKIDNSAKAWAEWEAWWVEKGLFIPEVFDLYKEYMFDLEENDDGSCTIIFYIPEKILDENGKWVGINRNEVERRTATAEEYAQFNAYWEARNTSYGDYDFNYRIFSEEAEEALEGIAAKYGLRLRNEAELILQKDFSGRSGDLTREEIIQKVNEICAGGASFFRTEPVAFEKFYYYDEGTFGVNIFIDDALVDGVSCYIYNSPYSTLSSGDEVINSVHGDIDSFTTRSHTTPDGTILTVMDNGRDYCAYVYLENSYVAIDIGTPHPLTDAEVDAILDMVDFSTIG